MKRRERKVWVGALILPVPLTACVSSAEASPLSMPQFPSLKMAGDNKYAHPHALSGLSL